MQERPWSISRLAGDAELDRVVALEAASFANPWTREMLARELRHSDVTRVYVVKLQDGRVVAFCACWLVVDEVHINTLAVEEGERRQGIATALLEHVLADLAAAGATHATLEVRRSNAAALRLYERLGFAVAAVRSRYYSHPEEDALVLWRHNLGEEALQPPWPP
ncbi:MAG: ribosomal protein S18-alanine N-acetyltransferase [Acidobacteriota bacterium]|nr:ribosomal protein S18-alanine N-acetyltransferase [Acidobacteriota bacterium]